MQQREADRLFNGVQGKNIAIVVAHPDDEAIGFCSVLAHAPDALVIHVTDGAPEDPKHWKKYGTRRAYAEHRLHELNAALDEAGHIGSRVSLNLIDRSAASNMVEITLTFVGLFLRHHISLVFTHAFEGGHPDHDAIAFAVNTTAQKRGARIIEAPFYRAANGASVWQEFVPYAGGNAITVQLSRSEQAMKRRMLAAHESQGTACGNVSTIYEQFREVPAYDFLQPPNDGKLGSNYERAGLTSESWSELVRVARTCV